MSGGIADAEEWKASAYLMNSGMNLGCENEAFPQLD
jgi:hypothetical protein